MSSLYTSAQCRELDRIAIAEHGIPGFELMQRAGRAAFDVLADHWPSARSITLFCGKGNNAGDGYIVAGLARQLGFDVQLLQIDPGELQGDAAKARDWAAAQGVKPTPANETPAPTSETPRPTNETPTPMSETLRGDVLVDALLGTGLKGVLREPYLGAARRINASGRPVLALDVPTGVNGDTGGLAGEAVRADVTVSFIGPKLGLHTGPALGHRGELAHAGLGVPPSVLEAVPGCPLLKFDKCALPRLEPSLYKHRMGHLAVLGGDKSMGGAPIMAGEAALRAGAGLVSLATRAAHRPAALARRPELMVQDADEDAAIAELLSRATAVVLGPGLGRNPWGERLFRMALEAAKPMLIDADGLHWLADLGARPKAAAVITPHAAEAAHLLGLSSAEVQANRPEAALKLAEAVDGVAVLKGAGTVCAEPGRLLGICGHGNPGMATAGMGDALSGLIGSFLAQGFGAAQAATLGTCLHSCAADLAAERLGQRSLLTADLFPALAELLR